MKRICSLLLCLMTLSSLCAAESMPAIEDEEFVHVRFRAVGDLMAHDAQLRCAKQEDGSYDFHEQYALVSDTLADADYTIGNLETTVDRKDTTPYSGFPCFNTPLSVLDTIKDAGVDFLTLANNHMLDRYYDGMCLTVDSVESYGFAHGGAFRTKEESKIPNVIEINGIRFGFLCYTFGTNSMEKRSAAAAKQYGVAYLGKADFAADVQALRDAGAEFVICMPHWGAEYLRSPQKNVRSTAERMIRAGVDVILGSHSHTVQPIEYVTVNTDEGERTGLVAWSMGNFISNMTKQYTDSGIIVEFTVYRGTDGGLHIGNAGYIPVYCWHHDNTIQVLSSEKYYEERPEGMGDRSYKRMRASRNEIKSLIGSEFALLAE